MPPPMIGRDDALATLEQAFSSAVDYNAPQLVTIVGAQGVGKTRLTAEWLARLATRAERPRIYRARAKRGGAAHSLIGRLLKDRFGIVESDDLAARIEKVRVEVTQVFEDRRMTEVIYFLGRFLDLRLGDNAFLRAVSTSDDLRHEDGIARTVLRRFLELDAQRSPLVLAFDDVQSADDESLTLLQELAAGLGGSPVVMLAATRPDLWTRRPTWGEGNVDHTRVELRTLERPDAESLLRKMLEKAAPLPPLFVDDACTLTAGNPYFLGQLVQVLWESGTLTVEGERWKLDPVRATQAELPMTVEAAIEARIAALSLRERQTLERGATFGNVFWIGAVLSLERADTEKKPGGDPLVERAELIALLDSLIEQDYLLKMPDSTVPGEVEFVFKHNLEHDLVERALVAERARQYCRRGAEWLESHLASREQQSGEQLEFLASLYERGGDARRAAECYFAAAGKARTRYANDAAATLYEKAIALFGDRLDLDRVEALHHLGDVRQLSGKMKEALLAFDDMLDAAWRLDQLGKMGAAHLRRGRVHRLLGDYRASEVELDQSLKLFRLARDVRGLGAAEDELGRIAYARGAYPVALQHHERSLELRRSVGDERSLALSLHNLALVHDAIGAHDEALLRFSEALDVRRRISDRPGIVQTLMSVSAAWRERGQPERGIQVLQEAAAIAVEIGAKQEQATAIVKMAALLAGIGESFKAQVELDRIEPEVSALRDPVLGCEIARLRAELALVSGDPRTAREHARRAVEGAVAIGSQLDEALARRTLAMVVFQGGVTDSDRSEAREQLEIARAILERIGQRVELERTAQLFAQLS